MPPGPGPGPGAGVEAIRASAGKPGKRAADQRMLGTEESTRALTERVLYEFLPSALNVMLPHCNDPLQELCADKCRAVAGAALAVSALMNAPPGFLEFLLCVPWRKLSPLCIPPESDSIDKLISNLHVTDEERRRLVSTRIAPALMPTVLNFLYRGPQADAVPPMLRLTKASDTPLSPDAQPPKPVTLELVAALLDGATPLHCAALRGSPAQIEHLLSCGADPVARTAAGELPVELVPVCGALHPITGQPICRCMGQSAAEADAAECKSSRARALLVHKCLTSPRLLGVWTWLKMLVLCVLCLLGQWGWHTSVSRPVTERHVTMRREQKRSDARVRAQALMARMRAEAQQGHVQLAIAKQDAGSQAGRHQPWEPGEGGAGSAGGPGGVGVGGHALGSVSNGVGGMALHHLHGGVAAVGGSGGGSVLEAEALVMDLTQAARPPPAANAPTSIHDINAHLKESEAVNALGEEQASEKAFKCFVRAVHALQSLDLQGDTMPQVFCAEGVSSSSSNGGGGSIIIGAAPGSSGGAASSSSTGAASESIPESPETHILEDEQADLYCCWAESVLLKFSRTCTCPGCAALAVQAVRMAHIQATRLFARMERKRALQPERWQAVAHALARVVHVHISLLLDTEVQSSPTRAAVWRAEQCLKEWDRLVRAGLTSGCSAADLRKVEALQLWARTADSDLYIAEALLGSALAPTQSLQEVLAATIGRSPAGAPFLSRAVNHEVVAQLEQAITLALTPSPSLNSLARKLVQNSTEELAAGARLRDIVTGKGVPAGGETAEAVAMLGEAIRAAEVFPRLASEVSGCRGLQEKWMRRAGAVERLDAVVEDVRQYTVHHPLTVQHSSTQTPTSGPASKRSSDHGGGAAGHQVFGEGAGGDAAAAGVRHSGSSITSGGSSSTASSDLADWDQKIKFLEGAINEAKESNISVNKAKRLLKEMQAQATAAEAARTLEATLSRKPAGLGALKAVLAKAEAAASSLSAVGTVCAVAEVLLPLIQASKRRLDVERAADVLHKASLNCRTVTDLPKLEAAILNARKVGAEELDPDMYRTASDARARLAEAAKARSALDAALRSLQKGQRPEDADALDRAIVEAARWEELLGQDVGKAKEVLDEWRTQAASEAKLSRALRDGASIPVLARAIQDAAAAGVKVTGPRKLLKLMQAVEAALGSGGEGTAGQLAVLQARLEAAEAGGVPASFPIMQAGARAAARLRATEAREALEAALKPHSDWSVVQRLSALRAALDKAEEVVGADTLASVCQPSSHAAADKDADAGGGESRSGSSSRSEAAASNGPSAPHTSVDMPGAVNGNSGGLPPAGQLTSGGCGDVHDASERASASSQGAAGRSSCGDQAMSITISDDDAAMAMVLELARRAHCLLDEDQRELARLEAERTAAERERRERQERERVERLRLEQERQSKERTDAAERERSAAEKREKARADKQVARARGVKLDLAAVAAAPPPAKPTKAAAPAGKKPAPAAVSSPPPNPAAPPYIPSAAAAAAAGVAAPAAPAPPALPAAPLLGRKDYRSVVGGSKPDPKRAAATAARSGTVLPPRPPHTEHQPLGMLGVGASAAGAHARGDSLESLGDPALKLNKDMLDALDLLDDVGPGVGQDSSTAAPGRAAGRRALSGRPSATHSGDRMAGQNGGSTYPVGPHFDGVSQQASSAFSSATSADDILGPPLPSSGAPAVALHAHGQGAQLLQPSGSELLHDVSAPFPAPAAGASLGGPDWAVGSSGSGGGARRFGFVDLGGAAWGVDAPSLGIPGVPAGPTALFPSLHSSISEFTTLLGGAKPDGGMWQAPSACVGVGTSAFEWDTAPTGLGGEDNGSSALAAVTAPRPSFDAAATRLWGALPGVSTSLGPDGVLNMRGSTGSLQPSRLASSIADSHPAGMNGTARAGEWEDGTGNAGGAADRFSYPALPVGAAAGGCVIGLAGNTTHALRILSGAGSNTGGIGSFAYGAPGTDAFGGAGARGVPSKHASLGYDSQSVSPPNALGNPHTLQSPASGRSMYASVLGDGVEEAIGAPFQLPDSLEFE